MCVCVWFINWLWNPTSERPHTIRQFVDYFVLFSIFTSHFFYFFFSLFSFYYFWLHTFESTLRFFLFFCIVSCLLSLVDHRCIWNAALCAVLLIWWRCNYFFNDFVIALGGSWQDGRVSCNFTFCFIFIGIEWKQRIKQQTMKKKGQAFSYRVGCDKEISAFLFNLGHFILNRFHGQQKFANKNDEKVSSHLRSLQLSKKRMISLIRLMISSHLSFKNEIQ